MAFNLFSRFSGQSLAVTANLCAPASATVKIFCSVRSFVQILKGVGAIRNQLEFLSAAD